METRRVHLPISPSFAAEFAMAVQIGIVEKRKKEENVLLKTNASNTIDDAVW